MSTDVKPKAAAGTSCAASYGSRGRQVRGDVCTWRQHQATARREARQQVLPMRTGLWVPYRRPSMASDPPHLN